MRGSTLLAGCLLIGVAALPTPAEESRSYQIDLEPGEGAIILVGDDNAFDQVRSTHFSDRAVKPVGVLDRLLLGFFSGTSSYGRHETMSISENEYLDRMLRLYAQSNATAVFAYQGNMSNGTGARFARIAARHGLKAILQPNDLYFRGDNYWQSTVWTEGLLKGYDNAEDYARRALLPKLEQWAPPLAENSDIFAWQPTEELPPESEVAYAAYKASFKRLLPKHLIFQIDSQQNRYEKLASKREPYPDIVGYDRYPWWSRPAGVGLWTPHYAARWLYQEIPHYTSAVHRLFDAPCVFVMQGCGELSWTSKEDGESRYKWAAREDYVDPRNPVRWVERLGQFAVLNRYLPPDHAWRMQNWIAISAGYKGLMYWSGGPNGSPAATVRAWQDGESTRMCLINDDLTCHRHLAEVARSFSEIRRYESLILRLRPVEQPAVATTNESNVYVNHLRDDEGRNYVMVVNCQIGSWDEGRSPEHLNDQSTLSVGPHGELLGYKPLHGKRTVRLESTGEHSLYDLRTMTLVAPEE